MKETNKNIEFEAECEKCNHKFTVGISALLQSVIKRKVYTVNDKEFTLTFYDCPKCKTRHFVQIDTEFTEMLLKNVSAQFIKFSKLKSEGKEISKKQQDNFKRNRKHLAEIRKSLAKKYTGCIIHDDETDETFTLRFSNE